MLTVLRAVFLVLICLFAGVNPGNGSALERQLLIIYGGDTRGYVEGCG